jgi:beta-xylosidase
MVRTKDPRGQWSEPTLVKKAYGNIDPCPLWDDDGKAYLVHAFAHSRAGVKSMLQVDQLSPDGTKVIDKGTIVFDGHKNHPTIEGPKFYKRNGYYYIFAPAGGVATGWQTVLRSKNVYGPYEDRIVMSQGKTPINGPHQGGLVELANGESWFLHFQDRGPFGRIVHLEPVKWVDDWPVIGDDSDGDGTGQPVLDYAKPRVDAGSEKSTPQQGDEFDGKTLSLEWQWQANPRPEWLSLDDRPGWLRLRSLPTSGGSLWEAPNVLLQKFPAPEFTATTMLEFSALGDDAQAGLVVMGQDYASLSVRINGKQHELTLAICKDADRGKPETVAVSSPIEGNAIWLRVEVKKNAVCQFAFCQDGSTFEPIGKPFQARTGQWIGATVGLFSVGGSEDTNPGHADFDFLRVE